MSCTNGSGALREMLDAYGGNLKDLTVLAVPNDPFRCDTPAGHRDGAWLAGSISTPVYQIAAVQVVSADTGQVLLQRSL